MFLATEATICTSLNGLKNEGIECKKVRVSDSHDYLLYSFSEVSKVLLNYDKKELLLETQSIAKILNSCSIDEKVNIEAVIINLSAKKNISSATSVLFVRKAVAHGNTGSIEISFYNDAADETRDGKCYKISNLTLNTYLSERILKSSAPTEVTLVESHNIVVIEMTQTLEKEMKGKFTSIDLKSLTPINICSTCKTVLTEEMINDDVAECPSCNMISTDYNSLNLVNIVFQPRESHQKINLKANHSLIEKAFKMNVKISGKIAMEMLRSSIALSINVKRNVIISLSKQ